MNTAREVRDDFVNAIASAIDDEELVTSAVSVAKEGDHALRISYDNGKTFRVSVEEIR